MINNLNTKKLQKLLELNRILILNQLLKEDTCVCEMVDILDIKHNLLSHHLKILSDMGYITSIRNGKHIIYHLIDNQKVIINNLINLVQK